MTGVGDLVASLRQAVDPCTTFETVVGGPAEPWQRDVLLSRSALQVLLCARQVGKTACLASVVAHRVRYRPDQLALLIGPTERQARNLYARVRLGLRRLPGRIENASATELLLDNGSRVVALPGDNPDGLRSFAAVDLLVCDEAAWIRPETYTAALPMRGPRGRLLLASSPGAREGFLWEAWNDADPVTRWQKHRVTVAESAQWPPERIAEQRATMSPREAAVELDCQWAGRADGVFDPAKIEAAFAHTPAAIRLPAEVWS